MGGHRAHDGKRRGLLRGDGKILPCLRRFRRGADWPFGERLRRDIPNVTGIRQEFLECIEQLIWYDADAELIFTITSTEQRTAAQLITLAESVAK